VTPSQYLHEVNDTQVIERRDYQILDFRGLAVLAKSIRPQQKEHSVGPFGPDTDWYVPTATFRQADLPATRVKRKS
jgi:hypothetical protein